MEQICLKALLNYSVPFEPDNLQDTFGEKPTVIIFMVLELGGRDHDSPNPFLLFFETPKYLQSPRKPKVIQKKPKR